MNRPVEPGRFALGCAPLGNLYRATDDQTAFEVVDTAWSRGVRVFDTAPLYGHGLSESRVGAALAARPREEFLLASKVGRLLVADDPAVSAAPTIFADVPPVHPVFDFSGDGVLRSVEESLGRLGLDRIDIVHVHDPDDHLDEAALGAFPALVRLRDEGVIGAIGLGTNTVAVGDRFVGAVDLDWLLLAGRHTLLEPAGALPLFERCIQEQVQVMAAGVFNSGVLARPVAGAPFDYAPAPARVLERAQRMAAVCAGRGVPLAAAAVQFPLRHPAVRLVVVGAASAAEVDDDVSMLDVAVPDALWSELAAMGAGDR